MPTRLTILCDNSVSPQMGLLGEHGFACLVETEHGPYLFDTGQGLAITQNCRVLGKDLAQVRAVILSHGHYDHTGGLPEVLHRTGPVPVVAHPGLFCERYRSAAGHRRFIGLPFRQPYLESLGAQFTFIESWTEVGPGLYASGEIPRREGFFAADAGLVMVGKHGEEADTLVDDLSLAVRTERGLVVLLGCAHAGLANILRHVRKQAACDRIYAVLGGTHLGFAGEAQFEEAVQALEDASVERIGLSHCTGPEAAARLQARLGSRVFFAGVGSFLEG
ncbi:MAG: MBL fold metallo-hydrolase [Desulfuromonadales bacterium]